MEIKFITNKFIEMNNMKILLGFLSGIATGTLLGVLIAPAKGASTRKKILRKGEGYIADLGDKMDSITDGISSKFDSAKKEVTDIADNGKSKLKS